MLFIIVISSLKIVILQQFSFVDKKNVHRVYITVIIIIIIIRIQTLVLT